MTALTTANFIWIGATLSVFGLALFPLYARTTPKPTRKLARLATLILLTSAGVAVALHVALLGASWRQIAATGLGRTWITQLVIAVALAAAAWRGPSPLVALLAGAELVGFALVAHANAIAAASGATLQALHLLAAGGWLGGVIALTFALGEPNAGAAVRRFSWVGPAFVAVIGVTGMAVLFTNTGALLPIRQMRYGQLALTKIALFAAALACAAFSRFVAAPRTDWRTMARVIAGELALLVAIIAAAVLLAQSDPYG